jgi:hypothetical protein
VNHEYGCNPHAGYHRRLAGYYCRGCGSRDRIGSGHEGIREVQNAVQQANVEQQVEIALSDSEVLAQSMASNKEIVLTKGNVELRVRRDERGRCTVCAKGKGHSKEELKQMAEQFSQKMTQCFVYNRVATEIKSKGFQVVNEEVMDDEAIRINVRRWMD